jgi:hypothetical protein
MKFNIQSLVGDNHSRVVAGSATGRKLLAALIHDTPAGTAPEKAFLDFTGIDVATVSFLRESLIGYRDFTRSARHNIYPIVANPQPAVVEELEALLRARSDALWCCWLNAEDHIVRQQVIGELDSAQRQTFEKVCELGTSTAPQLAEQFSNSGIGVTAWNNRLSGLVAKGLLVETRQGRTKTFRPVLEGS